jgi:hypothetical protein
VSLVVGELGQEAVGCALRGELGRGDGDKPLASPGAASGEKADAREAVTGDAEGDGGAGGFGERWRLWSAFLAGRKRERRSIGPEELVHGIGSKLREQGREQRSALALEHPVDAAKCRRPNIQPGSNGRRCRHLEPPPGLFEVVLGLRDSLALLGRDEVNARITPSTSFIFLPRMSAAAAAAGVPARAPAAASNTCNAVAVAGFKPRLEKSAILLLSPVNA